MANVPRDLLDRIRDLERQVRELAGRSQTRPAMNQVVKGDLRVGEGGAFGVYPPGNRTAIFATGFWGGTEYGMAIRRLDGSLALSVRNGTDDKLPQPLRLHDSRGVEIWSDDVKSGGMARPFLGLLPPQNTNPASWPRTTESGWTVVARSFNVTYHPRIRLYMDTDAPSGTAGQVRVRLDGTDWGPTVAAGTAYDFTGPTRAGVEGLVELRVEARRTSGSGAVAACPVMLYGCMS
ncbi:hypothetical protein [Streptomyces mobaraensis]|uniref:Uncharacterized protein n=1 Tax=Streptomyces mobaraensis TaxID=35621 RepID=A0A5N5VYY7_STRMB|nr:hypothetical protein [Streptomyces mobaraensis]KAB7834073.1 hypothetical protein FRZ00_30905 [Streptomyces mobaraensis]